MLLRRALGNHVHPFSIAVRAAATQAPVPRVHPSCVRACSLSPDRKAWSCVLDETRREEVSQREQGDGPVPRGRHEARVVTGCRGHHAAESPHVVGVPEDSTAQRPLSRHGRSTAADRRSAYTGSRICVHTHTQRATARGTPRDSHG